jgi:hypothetical protein
MPHVKHESPKPLLIFPCNGNGVEALDCLGDEYRMIGFVDDTPAKQASTRFGYPVRARAAFLEDDSAEVLAVPGSPTSFLTRRQLVESLNLPATRFARVVHPTARVPLATIGHAFSSGRGPQRATP